LVEILLVDHQDLCLAQIAHRQIRHRDPYLVQIVVLAVHCSVQNFYIPQHENHSKLCILPALCIRQDQLAEASFVRRDSHYPVQTEKFFGGILTIAFEIKDRLRIEIGEWMRCSIGISYNRLLAKLASSQIKPDGLFLITEENVLDLLDKADLMDVCGIGFALNRRLRMLGIDSFVNLRAANLEFLHKHFGPYWSVHLYNTARGIDNSQVLPITEIPDAKSVGRTYTTYRNLYKKTEILKLIRNLCEETTFKARQMRLSGRYIGLVLRSGQSEVEQQLENKPGLKKFYKPGLETNSKELSFYGHRTLKNYIDDGKRLFDICREIFSDWSFGEAQSYMRFCGVTLGMLTRSKYLTTPHFSC